MQHTDDDFYLGWNAPTNKVCQDCAHAFYDPISSPLDIYCGKYRDPNLKPIAIQFDGASCEFYEHEPNPPDYLKSGDPIEKLEKLAKLSRILKH